MVRTKRKRASKKTNSGLIQVFIPLRMLTMPS